MAPFVLVEDEWDNELYVCRFQNETDLRKYEDLIMEVRRHECIVDVALHGNNGTFHTTVLTEERLCANACEVYGSQYNPDAIIEHFYGSVGEVIRIVTELVSYFGSPFIVPCEREWYFACICIKHGRLLSRVIDFRMEPEPELYRGETTEGVYICPKHGTI